MHAVVITEYFTWKNEQAVKGGVEARALALATGLIKKGHTISIVTSWRKGEKHREEWQKNLFVHRVGAHHAYTHSPSLFSRLRFAWNAARYTHTLVKKCNTTNSTQHRTTHTAQAQRTPPVDVVEGYNFVSYLPAYYAAKRNGLPALATYHEVWLGKWMDHYGFAGLAGALWESLVVRLDWKKVIVVSKTTAQDLLTKTNIPKKKIVVVPNGIDRKIFTPFDVKNPTKLYAAKFQQPTLITIARLTKNKRIDDLTHAVAVVKKTIPDIRCIVIGVGDEHVPLVALAERLGVRENMHFLGFLDDKQRVVELLQRSKIFCLPSVLEGFGMVLLETMACGTPYVCSDIPVLRETTAYGKGGLLFRQKNSHDLAQRILALLRDKELYQHKREEGLIFVQRYDWDGIATQLEHIYREILKERNE